MKHTLASVDKDWTLFLDRDGVINDRPFNDYVKNPEQFVFLENVPQAIQSLNKIFKYTFIITNQQGISKGLMTVNDLEIIHKFMHNELSKFSARIDDVFFCPDKKEDKSLFRKPNVGMALAARRKYPDINFKKTIMVGDSITDMMFGKKLNMLTVFISDDLNEVKKNASLIDYHFKSLFEFLLNFKK